MGLLNLAEFMEQKGHVLPINMKILSGVAEICHSYAKALHYKEQEFRIKPWGAIENLMSINNRLQQSQAADGILEYALQNHDIPISARWYEELNRWDDALDAYERCQLEEPDRLDYTIGRMRCLKAMGNWGRLDKLSKRTWERNRESDHRKKVATFGAFASWNLDDWDSMEEFVKVMDPDRSEGSFLNAVMAVHNNDFDIAMDFIQKTRTTIDEDLTTVVTESYDRAYKYCVFAQQLVELEEVIKYKKTSEPESHDQIRKMWSDRLKGCKRDVDVWQRLLQVRSLVINPSDDEQTWLEFSQLCRESGRLSLSLKVLKSMVGQYDLDVSQIESAHVAFAFTQHLWATGQSGQSMYQLGELISLLEAEAAISDDVDKSLLSRCYLKLGNWQQEEMTVITLEEVKPILRSFSQATICDPQSCNAWHTWALMNYEVINHFSRENQKEKIEGHLVPAIQGFFKSIELDETSSFQDILRLLNLWFNHGFLNNVREALEEGFATISVDTWLSVIPQIIARIHTSQPAIRDLIHDLFHRIGAAHPQALVYPLTVASKSQRADRQQAAKKILDSMRMHSAKIVDEAALVSKELIRVAILWHEMWHEALEEASRIYFTNNDVEGMFAQLEPLHEMMRKGPETLREKAFRQAFGRDLGEAEEWCSRYKRTKAGSDLNQAWEYYCQVFRRINKQLPQLVDLDLTYVSEKLKDAHDLDLAMPGTYIKKAQSGSTDIVRIARFNPTLKVLESKQRPRRLTIIGSDGKDYDFLLKGHEDLRQDERVMQLFSLINTLLAHDVNTSNLGLRIKRYNIIPLSPNSGLIEWMGHTDTVHNCIKQYREYHKILLDCEHRLIKSMAPTFQGMNRYNDLTLIQKVEVFKHVLSCTSGMDLAIISWLNAQNSEDWLRKRTNYTRSLAVMSMVGYILGLGDRHPMNLLIHRLTGKLIHIDFGDCFEVAMQRDKFPERVPFRLTRMLVRAMEVSGIEGNYKLTCEVVMSVLRENKESLMAVLEAFVYDPLINWRLLRQAEDESEEVANPQISVPTDAPHKSVKGDVLTESVPVSRSSRQSRILSLQINNSSDKLNQRALTVLTRVSNKLRGKDFKDDGSVNSVEEQIELLVQQATNHENLCQAWIGWCPFW